MLTGRCEDYLEAIYNIHTKKGYVRVKDVAAALNVKYSSVTEMLKKLKTLHMISYEKYGGVVLSEKGLEIASVIKDRHDTLVRLFAISGVPAETADKDACVIEHHLSPRSLEGLKRLVNTLENENMNKMLKYHLES